jgi:DNA polymerase-3 subunit alpha
MLLELDIDRAEAIQELAVLLPRGEAGRGEVLARLHLEDGRTARVRLGRDFALDGELAEQLAEIDGIANVSLTARRGSDHLRLVA